MGKQAHWEKVYQTKAPDAVSWYRPHLEKSLELIKRSAAGYSASIIDVGGGESTLVDDLLANGFCNITVLDISPTAIDTAKKRLGEKANQVTRLAADITKIDLPEYCYDVWHDRAVFHFLTEPPHSGQPMFDRWRGRSSPAVTSSWPLSVRKARLNAAALMWCAMTPMRCTMNSGPISG